MSERTDYAPLIATVIAANEACLAAKRDRATADHAMRRAAKVEAEASLARAGIFIGETILALKGRWAYQDKPVLIDYLTCWSSPVEIDGQWQIQAHYVRARKDGKPYKDGSGSDYWNVVVDHPADAGAAVRKRLPIWGERRND